MSQAAIAGDAKLTRNQGLVLSVLEGAGQPLSAYGILDRLRDEGLKAPLQVYRALDKLVEVGRVHRLESMNAFVVCCHSNHGHIHPGSRRSKSATPAARSPNFTMKPWKTH